jgi:hypothetical protein
MSDITLKYAINNNCIEKAIVFLELNKFLKKHEVFMQNNNLRDLKEDEDKMKKSIWIMQRTKMFNAHWYLNGIYYPLFKRLEILLINLNITTQSRNKNKKVFNNNWNINLGRLINARGCTGFEKPHNIDSSKGVSACIIPNKFKPIWNICKRILNMFDEDYGKNNDYAVAINCMNSLDHFVKFHVDSHDISHQYCLALGTYKGAETEIIINGKSIIIDYYYRIVKMDGRCRHRVLPFYDYNNSYIRFGIIWYKLYDRRKYKKDEIYNQVRLYI